MTSYKRDTPVYNLNPGHFKGIGCPGFKCTAQKKNEAALLFHGAADGVNPDQFVVSCPELPVIDINKVFVLRFVEIAFGYG